MCIISLAVEDVSHTKIFVAPASDGITQLTVYANDVDNKSNGNAMILPVPFPNSVKAINLESYKTIFDDCDKSFSNMTRSYSIRSNSLGLDDSNSLEVFNVGSYQVSLAKSLDDLKRVNTNVFVLSPGCREVLQQHYTQSYWGFIICKLVTGREHYHPFAYQHRMIAPNHLFIPTRHYHHEPSAWNTNTNIADDWGHDIYIYNSAMDTMSVGIRSTPWHWDGTCHINKHKLPFSLSKLTSFNKISIKGSHPNLDLYATVI